MRVILSREKITALIAYLRDGVLPAGLDKEGKRRFRELATRFVVRDDNLYAPKGEEYLEAVADDDPIQLRSVLDRVHFPGHRGVKSMYMYSLDRFVGFKRERIDEYVRRCEACQRERPIARRPAMTPIIADSPWQHIQADLVDMREFANINDGFCWILNVVDVYSKFCFSFPLKAKSADVVSKAFRKLFQVEGAPIKLQTDNGREFSNQILQELCASMSILMAHGRPRHPQSQGQIERLNQTIHRALSRALSGRPKRWIDVLDDVVHQYNVFWHRAINSSPMQLFRRRPGINGPVTAFQEPSQPVDPILPSVSPADSTAPDGFEDSAQMVPLEPFLPPEAAVSEPQSAIDASNVAGDDLDMGIEGMEVLPALEESSCATAPWSLGSIGNGDAFEVVSAGSDDAMEPSEIIPLDSDVIPYDQIEYQHRYIERMVRDYDVHRFKATTFNPGDRVLVAKDFDNNPATRKRKLSGFFEDEVWTITARIGRENFELECNGTRKQVSKNRLRKLHEPWSNTETQEN